MTLSEVAPVRHDGEAAEAELARRSFLEFLHYVWILDPPPMGAGEIKLELWPHLLDLVETLLLERLIVILKARQVGVSWLLAAYALWTVLYHRAAIVLMISKGQDEAAELLGKAKFIHAHLPLPMQGKIGIDNGREYAFPGVYTKIMALPSTEGAGRSETASVVMQDEADYHDHLDVNFTAVKPTIDAGGQLIQASTSNKIKVLSLFKQLYRGSPDNGWVKRFFPWHCRPGRDEEWYRQTRDNVPVTQTLSPDLYMEQEYPSTEEEALSPSRAAGFFDADALLGMLDDCTEPRQQRVGKTESTGHSWKVSIWRKPVVAAKYVAGGDLCWGETGAYSCLTVVDWQTGEQVAEMHGRLPEDEMAQEAFNLCTEYNKAYLGVENNGEGVNVVNKLVELGYGKRMFYEDREAKEPKKPGWNTNSSTRPVMLGELAETVRNLQIRPRSREAVGEMLSFIRNEKLRPEHSEGAYDDRVMSWAIAWQMRKYAHFGAVGKREPVTLGRNW